MTNTNPIKSKKNVLVSIPPQSYPPIIKSLKDAESLANVAFNDMTTRIPISEEHPVVKEAPCIIVSTTDDIADMVIHIGSNAYNMLLDDPSSLVKFLGNPDKVYVLVEHSEVEIAFQLNHKSKEWGDETDYIVGLITDITPEKE